MSYNETNRESVRVGYDYAWYRPDHYENKQVALRVQHVVFDPPSPAWAHFGVVNSPTEEAQAMDQMMMNWNSMVLNSGYQPKHPTVPGFRWDHPQRVNTIAYDVAALGHPIPHIMTGYFGDLIEWRMAPIDPDENWSAIGHIRFWGMEYTAPQEYLLVMGLTGLSMEDFDQWVWDAH